MKLELLLALVCILIGVGLAAGAGWYLAGPVVPFTIGVLLVVAGVLVPWERLR